MTRKFYALLASGDLVYSGEASSFSQAWLEEPADAVFILDDQGLEKLHRQSAELLIQDLPLFQDQDQDQDQDLSLSKAPTLNYSKLEAELLPHLVTDLTVEGWTVTVNMPELRGSFERARDLLDRLKA